MGTKRRAPSGSPLFAPIEADERAKITWRPPELPSLDGITDISLNFETTGLRWADGDLPIALSLAAGGRTWYLPWGHRGGGNLPEHQVYDWLTTEVRGKRITNINTKFDLLMSRAWGVDLEEQGNTFSDVAHYAALLDDNRRKFALDILAVDFLDGVQVPRLDERRMVEYHAGEAAARSEYNVALVSALQQKMLPLLAKQDLMRVKELEDAVIPVVVEMEWNGARIDVEKLNRWVYESEREVHQCLMSVHRATGLRMNPDSPEDWARLLKHLGLSTNAVTASGRPSYADNVLKTLDHPVVKLARRAGHIISLRSKYLLPYQKAVGADGILRYSLHQLRGDEYGTVRGRFSASNVNIQQVPRLTSQREMFDLPYYDKSRDEEIYLIRQLFIPGEGTEHLCADAAQIEFRAFVHYSKSERLLKIYDADPTTSFHKVVHAMIKPFVEVGYDKAKTYNFAKLYGSGVSRSAGLLKIDETEAKQLVEVYDREFPEAKALLGQSTHIAETRGYVRTLLGRRARYPDRSFAYRSLNAVIQGTAADIMKHKLVELHAERKNTGLLLRFTVHDEVDGDSPSKECTEQVRDILNRQSFPVPLRVPILWEVSSSPRCWAEAK